MPKNIESQPDPERETEGLEQFLYACELLGLSPDMSARGLLNYINPDDSDFEKLRSLSEKNLFARKRMNIIMDLQSILNKPGRQAYRLEKISESDPSRAKKLINKYLEEVNFKARILNENL